MEHNVLHKDNKSTILLATNGRWSSYMRTKHIKACYLSVKDKIESKEVEIKYEPLETMWADLLTKPKQGKQFHLLQTQLMICKENYNNEVERMRTHPDCLPMEEINIEDIDSGTI